MARTIWLGYTSVYTSLEAVDVAVVVEGLVVALLLRCSPSFKVGEVEVRMTYLPREAEAGSDRAILRALYNICVHYIYI